jgi:hypothetical protein
MLVIESGRPHPRLLVQTSPVAQQQNASAFTAASHKAVLNPTVASQCMADIQ